MNNEEFDRYFFSIINPGKEFSENDVRFREMKYMVQSSRLPVNCIGVKLDWPDINFITKLIRMQTTIQEIVDEGKQVYLYSKECGTGKTTFAVKLLLQYFGEVWPCNCFTDRGYFLSMTQFLAKLKSNINNRDEEFSEILDKIETVDIVVWDDIASTSLTEYDYKILFRYIDSRVMNGRSNIYTGNIPVTKLSDTIGERLASRMNYKLTTITFAGDDKRK